MNQTKSQNPNAMTLGSGKVEITKSPVTILGGATPDWQLTDLEDLGLARGIKITPSSTKIEIKADNGTVPLRGQTDRKVTVEFSLLERHIPMLAKLMEGLVKVKANPGATAAQSNSYPAGSVSKGVPIGFKKFNADGSKPTLISLTQGATTLVAGTDFEVIEYAGAWFFVILAESASFNAAAALVVAYTVTPPESYTMSRGSAGVATPLGMRVTNKRQADTGATISRVWELPYGYYSGEDTIILKSQADADAVAEVPLSFEFTPHPDMVDNADLEDESLMRETQEVV